MKNSKLSFLLPIILLSACASTEVKQELNKTPSMNDAQLKNLLVGKTMSGYDSGEPWTVKVNNDGTVEGAWSSKVHKGTYTIKDGQYCRIWNHRGKKACASMTKRANGYYAKVINNPSKSYNFTVK